MMFEPNVVEVAVTVVQGRAQFPLVDGLGAVLTQITLQTLGEVVVGAGEDGGRKGRARQPAGGFVRPGFEQTQQELGEQGLAERVGERTVPARFGVNRFEERNRPFVDAGVERGEPPARRAEILAVQEKLGVEGPHRFARPRGQTVHEARPKEQQLAGAEGAVVRPDDRVTGPAHDQDNLKVVVVGMRGQVPERLVVVAGDPQRFNVAG